MHTFDPLVPVSYLLQYCFCIPQKFGSRDRQNNPYKLSKNSKLIAFVQEASTGGKECVEFTLCKFVLKHVTSSMMGYHG